MARLKVGTLNMMLHDDTPSTKPKRTPIPVEECYGQLLDRREKPTVLESLKGREFWCEGAVSKIKRGSFQFHVNAVQLEEALLQLKSPEDQYLDCRAVANEQLEYLQVGERVVFRGRLDTAFPNRATGMSFFGRSYAVKFTECLVFPQKGPHGLTFLRVSITVDESIAINL